MTAVYYGECIRQKEMEEEEQEDLLLLPIPRYKSINLLVQQLLLLYSKDRRKPLNGLTFQKQMKEAELFYEDLERQTKRNR